MPSPTHAGSSGQRSPPDNAYLERAGAASLDPEELAEVAVGLSEASYCAGSRYKGIFRKRCAFGLEPPSRSAVDLLSKIYLDACCLNRPFDDQRQPRVRLEAEAILLVLQRIAAGGVKWLGSTVLEFEIGRMSDQERLRRLRTMLADVTDSVEVEEADILRGEELEALGFGDFDALHLACAERGGAEIFLTTDDRLLRRARQQRSKLRIQVANPVSWISDSREEEGT